jgi:hypothetical protein
MGKEQTHAECSSNGKKQNAKPVAVQNFESLVHA